MAGRGRPQDMIPGPQWEPTPDEYMGEIKYLNWNGYKLAILDENGLTKSFFDQISARSKKNQSVIIVITADPGKGKSYMALRFAQIFDPKYRILDIPSAPFPAKDIMPLPEEDPSQCVFERQHFHHLIGNDSPLDYGQVVMSDEAQYSLGARRWYKDIQMELVEAIESVRSKGLIMVIVALHLDLLDNIIRKFVLSYMFKVESRGLATIYSLYTPTFGKEMHKRRLGQMRLQIPDVEKCTNTDCLRCPYSGILRKNWTQREVWKDIGYVPCRSLRAIYERRKKLFVSDRSDLAAEKASQKAVTDRKIPDKELANILAQHLTENPEKTVYMKDGKLETTYIQIVLEDKTGLSIGLGKGYKIRRRLEIEHPEVAHKPEEDRGR